MKFEPGATIDAYRIVSTLGSGGMGEVFRVEHTFTKRQDAMKVLAGGRLRPGEQTERFLREIQLQASLNHPNIAAVHHALSVDDDLVMIMELVEGATLRSLLEAGRIPLQSVLNFASQMLVALDYAHQHGVVHRDVTPANILITPGGVVKLTDFGLAKSPTDMRFNQTGVVMGSLYYMSPEQVRGMPTQDARTDVYSAAVVLYEMATGVKPFLADNPFSLMLAHVQQTPVPPRDIDPQLPPGLNEIILTALAKEADKRFPSARAFRDALEELRESRPPVVVIPEKAKKWPRLQIIRFGAGIALVSAGLVAGLVRRGSTSHVPVVAAAPSPKPDIPRDAPVIVAVPPPAAPSTVVTRAVKRGGSRNARVAAAAPPRAAVLPKASVVPAVPRNAPVAAVEPPAPGLIMEPMPAPVFLPKVEQKEVAPPPRRSWIRRAVSKVARPLTGSSGEDKP